MQSAKLYLLGSVTSAISFIVLYFLALGTSTPLGYVHAMIWSLVFLVTFLTLLLISTGTKIRRLVRFRS